MIASIFVKGARAMWIAIKQLPSIISRENEQEEVPVASVVPDLTTEL